jgi:ribose 5-phosphate isomerase B
VKKMKISIGADHIGFELKSRITTYLTNLGYEVVDVGTTSSERTDYPLQAQSVAQMIQSKEVPSGILICGTGIGMSIAANKFRGIRAAVVSEPYSAKFSKEHNNANVLCFGARVVDYDTAVSLVDAWRLATYEGDRHNKRLDLISASETKEQR